MVSKTIDKDNVFVVGQDTVRQVSGSNVEQRVVKKGNGSGVEQVVVHKRMVLE